MENTYRTRTVDKILSRALDNSRVVWLHGLRGCGKSTTARRYAHRELCNAPRNGVAGGMPQPGGEDVCLVDEWQRQPAMWQEIAAGSAGYVLTSSGAPEDMDAVASGMQPPQVCRLAMRTMSLYESGHSTGEVSLGALFEHPDVEVAGSSRLDLHDMAWLMSCGGWPGLAHDDREKALYCAYSCYMALTDEEYLGSLGIKRSMDKTKRVLRAMARNQGAAATIEGICHDLRENNEMLLNRTTVQIYAAVAERLFITENVLPWQPALRRQIKLRSGGVNCFTDPSIGVIALGLMPDELLDDERLMRGFFRTLCVRDLRSYAEVYGGKVYYYHDPRRLECEAVVCLPDGRYGMVKTVLDEKKEADAAVRMMERISNGFDYERMPHPSFRMLLTASSRRAYRRDDGTFVVPIGCLRE